MSTSFFFTAMAVAGGISQFLTRAYLLLNSIQKKIEDDPEGKLGDEFQGQILAQKKFIHGKNETVLRIDWLSFVHTLSVIIKDCVLLTFVSHRTKHRNVIST